MFKKLKMLSLVALVFVAMTAIPSNLVQARSFGFHSSTHIRATPRIRSAPRVKTPRIKTPKEYNKNYRSYSSNDNNKKNSLNRSYRKSGLMNEFGRSIMHGAGWSIGYNMGNSLWHSMFGFGSNSYIGNNGQVEQQQGGFLGWIIVAAVIGLVVYLVRKHRNRM